MAVDDNSLLISISGSYVGENAEFPMIHFI